MSDPNELNLRWLAASVGLPEDEKAWSEEQLDRWILVVHDYQDKLTLEKLTKQLRSRKKEARKQEKNLHRTITNRTIGFSTMVARNSPIGGKNHSTKSGQW